jgi:hypothetical protein
MKIEIDTADFSPSDLGGLVALMQAKGRLPHEALLHVMAPHLPAAAQKFDPIIQRERELEALGDMTVSTLIEGVAACSKNFTVAELASLLADLNAELYSRNVIKPEDNPANGVALPAASVAGMDDTMHGGDSFARSEVVVGAGVDLAAVFGAAAKGPTDADIAGENQKSTDEQKPLTPATTTQLDKKGLPWDARIHASSKTINADGTWRQKRGVADALVTTVEAELRQVMALPRGDIPAADAYERIDVTTIDDTERKFIDGGPTVGRTFERDSKEQLVPMLMDMHGRIIPPPPPTATPAPPAPPAPNADPTTFPELVTFIAAQKVAGKLNQTQVQAALTSIGIEGALPVINSRLDLLPALVAKLRQIGGV